MEETEKKELGEEEKEACDGKKEQGVAEVRDADGWLGGWGALGVWEEGGLVLGAGGRPKDWNGDGGFF